MKLVIEIELTDSLHTMGAIGSLLREMGSDWMGSISPETGATPDLREPLPGPDGDSLFLMEGQTEPHVNSDRCDLRCKVVDEAFSSAREVLNPATTRDGDFRVTAQEKRAQG